MFLTNATNARQMLARPPAATEFKLLILHALCPQLLHSSASLATLCA